jgi:multidrug resistance efflux pump
MKYGILFMVALLLLILPACGTATGKSPEALPTVVIDTGTTSPQAAAPVKSGGVTASGIVVPAQEAQLAFTMAGGVQAVNVVKGDLVQAGKVLVELDNVLIQMEVDQAKRNLKELTSPSAVATAAQVVASAQKNLDDAQDKADSLFYPRASDTLIDNTQGEIDLAKQALARASDTYRQFARLPDGDSKKSTALVAMTNAQLRLNTLVAKYNWYSGKPTDVDAAIIQANLDVTKAALQEAQWYLAALKGEQLPGEATGTKLAQLQLARDTIKSAQVKLEKTRLIAPISGTVVAVNVLAGEYASPGEILIVISDVSRLHIETTDLSERDVPKVEVGQTVTVFVEALGQDVTGHVTDIFPLSDTLGGDVVYKTTIELDTSPDGLRAGMSVEVQFDIAQ